MRVGQVPTCTCRIPHMACDRKKKGTRVPHLEKKHRQVLNDVSVTKTVLYKKAFKNMFHVSLQSALCPCSFPILKRLLHEKLVPVLTREGSRAEHSARSRRRRVLRFP